MVRAAEDARRTDLWLVYDSMRGGFGLRRERDVRACMRRQIRLGPSFEFDDAPHSARRAVLLASPWESWEHWEWELYILGAVHTRSCTYKELYKELQLIANH